MGYCKVRNTMMLTGSDICNTLLKAPSAYYSDLNDAITIPILHYARAACAPSGQSLQLSTKLLGSPVSPQVNNWEGYRGLNS